MPKRLLLTWSDLAAAVQAALGGCKDTASQRRLLTMGLTSGQFSSGKNAEQVGMTGFTKLSQVLC